MKQNNNNKEVKELMCSKTAGSMTKRTRYLRRRLLWNQMY